ncbi:hypothetical protein CN488_31760 [Bacillus anthracis]|nr:hypothetical protein CN488_31760 [Bacillus anthracis]
MLLKVDKEMRDIECILNNSRIFTITKVQLIQKKLIKAEDILKHLQQDDSLKYAADDLLNSLESIRNYINKKYLH